MDALLRTAGIDPAELHRERWPIDSITRLWWAAVNLSGDAGFGLRVGRQAGPASFHVVGYILQSSATLRNALDQVQKYQPLISDGGRFQLLSGSDASWLIYHPRQGALAFSPHQIEAVLAALVSFVRNVTGIAIRPSAVRFSHSRLGPLSGYRSSFSCPVEFDQAFSGILLNHHWLDIPLPQADPQLNRVQENFAELRMNALEEHPDLASMLQAWIQAIAVGGQWPDRAQAARRFELSERTLARRLKQEGTSYSDLLDQVRRSYVLEALRNPRRTIDEVALQAGFSDLSPFYRSVQRWIHMTPAQWRNNGLPQITDAAVIKD